MRPLVSLTFEAYRDLLGRALLDTEAAQEPLRRVLPQVFYLLNLLAFVAHLVLQLGDRQYQQARQQETRKGLWEELRVLFNRFKFDSWSALLAFQLSDGLPEP